MSFAGLSLADVLRLQAQASSRVGHAKSVILVWLRGAASHIDSWDMKPNAPAEIRGEFKPVRTNVPGINVCEHLPLHAKMMDKLAIIRGIKSNDLGDHTPHYILTGFPSRGKRPTIGSIVSYCRPSSEGLPPYVSLMYKAGQYDIESPRYLGPAHRPFVPKAEGLANLSLPKGVSLDRLEDRKELLHHFDTLNREIDATGKMTGIDAYTRKAMEMVASPRARCVRSEEGACVRARALRQVL